MKFLTYFSVAVLLIAMSGFIQCEQGNYGSQGTVAAYAADGLDLKAVGELLKTSQDAQEFEKKLNEPGGVNNLDLDEDGKVDFIKVTSDDQQGIRTMKLTAVLSGSGELQDVAYIEVEKTPDQRADVQIKGNEQIYGSNHYYHSSFGLTDFLILSWLFSPRYSPYHSPWGYGSYPGYYGRGYAPVPVGTYNSRTGGLGRASQLNRTNNNQLSREITPTSRNVADRVKAPLRNPTTSQKAFQARNPSKQIRSRGFGSRSTRSRSFGSRSRSFGK